MKTILQLLAIASACFALTNCTTNVTPHMDTASPTTATSTTTRTSSDPYSPYSSSVTTQKRTTTY